MDGTKLFYDTPRDRLYLTLLVAALQELGGHLVIDEEMYRRAEVQLADGSITMARVGDDHHLLLDTPARTIRNAAT